MNESIEQQIQQNGKTAPRVTQADVEAAIASEHYFTGTEGVLGLLSADGVPATAYEKANVVHSALGLLTFCVLILRNGFTVTGESACVSPENFDAEIGRCVARDNAISKVWQLLGYALKERLATAPTSYQERVIEEKRALDEKLEKLCAFHETAIFAALPVEEQDRLIRQSVAMGDYSNVLAERIAEFQG